MKRFWLVLLALGMLFAFSSSVFAADVKFTGSFYAAGMYQNHTDLKKDNIGDNSTAFYYQRLRVGMYFVVTPALSLVTRFDAMERVWGAPRSAANTGGFPAGLANDTGSAGTVAENENIAFDWAYLQYVSPIGMFAVGYQQDGAWGTVFGDSSVPLAKIVYAMRTGPLTVTAYAGKTIELSETAKYATNVTDQDADKYVAAVIYQVSKDIQAGLLGVYVRNATGRAGLFGAASRYLQTVYGLQPYFKAKVGPLALEGEFQYQWGELKFEDDSIMPGAKVKIVDNMALYLNAVADLGMFYAGGTFAWIAGDKLGTADKMEGGIQTGGLDWNPTLILWNYDKRYWSGMLSGYGGTNATALMTNIFFYQVKAGVRPIPALDIMASLTYADAHRVAAGWEKDYGWELDLTATYAITNNLSYMLGVGYLWTGDYYKAGVSSNRLNDDYLVINKLTLTF